MGSGIGRVFNRKKTPEQQRISDEAAAAKAAKIERERLATRKEGGPRTGLTSGRNRGSSTGIIRNRETRGGLTRG